MTSGIFGMNLKSYLEEHVVCELVSEVLFPAWFTLFLVEAVINQSLITTCLDVMQLAFWLTTAGIIVGGIVTFFLMYSYLRARKIFWLGETSYLGNFNLSLYNTALKPFFFRHRIYYHDIANVTSLTMISPRVLLTFQ